jgi:beta-lactamase superfamily II metal-dependent hydrolase
VGIVTAIVLAAFGIGSGFAQRDTLDVYFVDVEGGQATLFVSPSGQSVLVDAGFPGERDAGRIAEVAKLAGVTRLDYFVNTHFHTDHIGGIVPLVEKVPVATFVDHGPTIEPTPAGRGGRSNYDAYVEIRGRGKYQLVKPGDALTLTGMSFDIVSAAGKLLTSPMTGAGALNPACAGFQPKDETANVQLGNENAQSVGMVIALGQFRLLDLGDLTWNREHELACPRNLLGTVDVYLTTHHGQDISNLPALVQAVQPRVAIMNNGGRKGGAVATFQTLRSVKTLEDLWQIHTAVAAGPENTSEPLIANLDDTTAHYIKLTARRDGSFTVTNSRNGHTKTYAARRP